MGKPTETVLFSIGQGGCVASGLGLHGPFCCRFAPSLHCLGLCIRRNAIDRASTGFDFHGAHRGCRWFLPSDQNAAGTSRRTHPGSGNRVGRPNPVGPVAITPGRVVRVIDRAVLIRVGPQLAVSPDRVIGGVYPSIGVEVSGHSVEGDSGAEAGQRPYLNRTFIAPGTENRCWSAATSPTQATHSRLLRIRFSRDDRAKQPPHAHLQTYQNPGC